MFLYQIQTVSFCFYLAHTQQQQSTNKPEEPAVLDPLFVAHN
jgi:hypothetical protein